MAFVKNIPLVVRLSGFSAVGKSASFAPVGPTISALSCGQRRLSRHKTGKPYVRGCFL